MYVTVEYNHGYAALIYIPYDRGYGVGFVGRHDDDVKSVVGKVADVGYLLVVVIVGRTDLDLSVFMKDSFATYLVVHFVAPVVSRALRHADAVFFLLRT